MANHEAPELAEISAEVITKLAAVDDFGFEMRIGRILYNYTQADIRHSQTYRDQATNKDREYDYQCKFQHADKAIGLAIECKNLSRLSPMVVSGHSRRARESFHEIVYSICLPDDDISEEESRIGDDVVYRIKYVGPGSDLYPTFKTIDSFVGKSVFKPEYNPNIANPEKRWSIKSDGPIFDRWNQAINSAADMALKSLVASRKVPDGIAHIFSLTLPVLVIPNGTLWRIEYDEHGTVIGTPTATDEIQLFRDQKSRLNNALGKTVAQIRMSHLHVFTEQGFANWLKLVSNPDSSFWRSAFPVDLLDSIARETRYLRSLPPR